MCFCVTGVTKRLLPICDCAAAASYCEYPCVLLPIHIHIDIYVYMYEYTYVCFMMGCEHCYTCCKCFVNLCMYL